MTKNPLEVFPRELARSFFLRLPRYISSASKILLNNLVTRRQIKIPHGLSAPEIRRGALNRSLSFAWFLFYLLSSRLPRGGVAFSRLCLSQPPPLSFCFLTLSRSLLLTLLELFARLRHSFVIVSFSLLILFFVSHFLHHISSIYLHTIVSTISLFLSHCICNPLLSPPSLYYQLSSCNSPPVSSLCILSAYFILLGTVLHPPLRYHGSSVIMSASSARNRDIT